MAPRDTSDRDRGRVPGRDAGGSSREVRAVYIISVAAELAGVHPQTLRIYERRGLIEPERTPGGSRRYSDRDIERLQRIQELTAEGLSLSGVERFIELEEQLDAARSEIQRLHGEIDGLRDEHRRVIGEVHRSYRRDLVPVRNEIELYRRRRRPPRR